MSGGFRLFWGLFCSLASLLFIVAVVHGADDDAQSSAALAPAKAEARPLTENFHGTKVTDNYRWLEDGKNPDTQKWVDEETAYTRSVLDPLPGRDAINKRLTELLTIGNIGVPEIAGKHYFYTKREGLQNQPVLYVRRASTEKTEFLSTPTNSPPMAPSPSTGISPQKTAGISSTALHRAVQR